MALMKAKFPGICHQCRGRFEAGDDILWIPGYVVHARCPDAHPAAAAAVVKKEKEVQTMNDLVALRTGRFEAYPYRSDAPTRCCICGEEPKPGAVIADTIQGDPRTFCQDCIFDLRVAVAEREMKDAGLDGSSPFFM